jgi:D-3-phosphoglycerate dehydrogenase
VVGVALGQARINIAGAQVGRTTRGGEPPVAETVDNPLPPDLLARIAATFGAREARAADLNPL